MLCGWRVHDTTAGMCAYRRAVIEDIEWTENTGLSAELLSGHSCAAIASLNARFHTTSE